jgi:hypothetical protein
MLWANTSQHSRLPCTVQDEGIPGQQRRSSIITTEMTEQHSLASEYAGRSSQHSSTDWTFFGRISSILLPETTFIVTVLVISRWYVKSRSLLKKHYWPFSYSFLNMIDTTNFIWLRTFVCHSAIMIVFWDKSQKQDSFGGVFIHCLRSC